jgi:hypothetical protein
VLRVTEAVSESSRSRGTVGGATASSGPMWTSSPCSGHVACLTSTEWARLESSPPSVTHASRTASAFIAPFLCLCVCTRLCMPGAQPASAGYCLQLVTACQGVLHEMARPTGVVRFESAVRMRSDRTCLGALCRAAPSDSTRERGQAPEGLTSRVVEGTVARPGLRLRSAGAASTAAMITYQPGAKTPPRPVSQASTAGAKPLKRVTARL